MADWPAPASILDDLDALKQHKLRVFSRMEIRDRLGNRSSYTPHKFQRQVHFPKTKLTHQVLACGRRGGKSKTDEGEALAMAGIEGTATWIGAPTYSLTDRVFQPVFKALVIDKIFGVSPTKIRNNPTHRYIEMPWGAIIEGKSAERPASSKGASLDLFISDESAEHDESYYTEYVGPGLADRQGRAIFSSTPLGLTWFHDYFKRGKSKKFQSLGWRSYTWRSEDNPYLDKAWLQQQKLMVSNQVWRQEYLAEFIARSGLIWDDFRDSYFDSPERGHLFNPDRHPLNESWPAYRGIDVGASHPTGAVWGRVDPQNNVWIYDEYFVKAPLHQEHARAIAAKTHTPILATWISWEADVGDGKGGETVRQVYRNEGVYANLAPKDRDNRIEAVAAYLRATLQDASPHPAVYISDRCVALRGQVLKYRWEDPKHGRVAPKPKPHMVGRGDDLCDALGHLLGAKPRFLPQWMDGLDSENSDYVSRYGYQESRFWREQNQRSGVIGIPGIATLPQWGQVNG